jgi:hypothetical protein
MTTRLFLQLKKNMRYESTAVPSADKALCACDNTAVLNLEELHTHTVQQKRKKQITERSQKAVVKLADF